MAAIILILSFCLPQVLADEGIVPILCANGYQAMPGEGATFPDFAQAIAQVIKNDTSLNLRPIVTSSLGEFVEYLAFPQARVGILSLYSVVMQEDLQLALAEVFKGGVGIIGINDAAVQMNLSEVFPIYANMTSPGRLGIVDGKLQMGHSYVKAADHPISEGLPDQIFFSDVELNWVNYTVDEKLAQFPAPVNGTMTVIYEVQGKDTCYMDDVLPAVIAYENIGRSVTLPAFGLTERGGPDDFSAVLYDPTFHILLRNCLTWAAGVGEATAQQRMSDMHTGIEAYQNERLKLVEDASGWKRKSSQAKMVRLAVFTVIGFIAMGAIYKVTFRGSDLDAHS